MKEDISKQLIVDYLLENGESKTIDIAKVINLSISRVRSLLNKLTEENIVISVGSNRDRRYKLK